MKPIFKAWCCQIDVTSYCPHNCLYCSRYTRHLRPDQRKHMDLELFEVALDSLSNWPNTIGVIGGEPLLHPQFRTFNKIIRKFITTQNIVLKPGAFKFGLWTSGIKSLPDPRLDQDIKDTYGFINYNPHDPDQLKKCRHQPLTIAINEVIKDEDLMWQLIDNCWVQRIWCPTITRKGAYFCEVGAAQDILLNDGINAWPITKSWWKRTPEDEEFIAQKRALCPNCGMPVPMKREKLEEKVEKFSPLLLEQFNQAGLRHIAENEVEVFSRSFSKEEVIRNLDGWYPGNYREDIRADDSRRIGFVGQIK